MKRLVVLVLLGATLAACGGGDGSGGEDALVAARTSLEGARYGRLDLEVRDGRGDHFGVSGPFSFIDSDGAAVLELTYEHQRQGSSGSTKVLATGTAGWIQKGAVVTSLTPAQLTSLRYAGDHSGAVPALALDAWVTHPEVDGSEITGGIDGPAMVADLGALAADIEGRERPGAVGDLSSITSSSIRVRTSGARHAFRSLTARIRFAEVTPALRAALGGYAARDLRVQVSLRSITRPLTVQTPR